MRFLIILAVCFSVSACGTISYLPAHGGGKRFSLEQALVSISARRAISELPVKELAGKRAVVQISIVPDIGGGYISSGGRPSVGLSLGGQIARFGNALGGTGQLVAGVNSSASEGVYAKDLNLTVSDEGLLNSLLIMKLRQDNITIVDGTDIEAKPDFYIEITADVFGLWRSRSDWLVKNRESLVASTSFEYVITPISDPSVKRRIGRIGYDARYVEKYNLWVGPKNKFEINTTESIFNKYLVGTSSADLGYDAYKTQIQKSANPVTDHSGTAKTQAVIIKQ